MKSAIVGLLSVVVALSLTAVSQGDVVYQSNFNTATNLTNAGMASVSSLWVLDTANDYLKWPHSGNTRGPVYTTNSWQCDLGFILDVTFRQPSSGVRFEMGLVTSTYGIDGSSYWLTGGESGGYGIGFGTSGSLLGEGRNAVSGVGQGHALAFNNGSGSGGDYGGSLRLSIDQGNVTYNALQTLSIKVTGDSWSYSLNGAPATTGSMTFDTSKSFRFCAYAQNINGAYISNITLTAIPPAGTVFIVR
jgi:hypothetical protein